MTEENDEFSGMTISEALDKKVIRSVIIPSWAEKGKYCEYHVVKETDYIDEFTDGEKALFGFKSEPQGAKGLWGGWHLFAPVDWRDEEERWEDGLADGVEVEPTLDVTYDEPRPLREVLRYPVEYYEDLLTDDGSEDHDD